MAQNEHGTDFRPDVQRPSIIIREGRNGGRAGAGAFAPFRGALRFPIRPKGLTILIVMPDPSAHCSDRLLEIVK
jgi:hypothetical protein